MKEMLKYVDFHDETIKEIKKIGNDIKIIANAYGGDEFTFIIRNARIFSYVEVDFADIEGTDIISLSYYEDDEKENYIHLETVSKVIPFTDEFYFYSNDITIFKN